MKKFGLLLAAGFTVASLSACAKKTYEITWKNWDDSVIKVDDVVEGSVPVFDGTPTRDDDLRYSYEFKAWSPSLVEATENASYTAVFTPVEKETKEAWTKEEKDLMESYLNFDLPFYKASFSVLEAPREDAIVLYSQRECDAVDLEAYAAKLEEEGYTFNAEATNEDFAYAFAELDNLATFEKRLADDEGNLLVDVQVVNFGLDEDKHLCVYSTTYLSMFGKDGYGTSVYYNYIDSQSLDYAEFTLKNYIFGLIADVFEVEDKFIVPAHVAEPNQTSYGFSVLEYSVLYPWMFGNYYSPAFNPMYGVSFINYSQEEIDTTVTALVDAGYQEQERKEGDKSSVFKLANGDKGFYFIEVGDLSQVQLTTGSVPAATYTFYYEKAVEETPAA